MAAGLKFGLYTSRSPYTCAGYAASCQHETVDANQYAAWLVDYVKDDSCGKPCAGVLLKRSIIEKCRDGKE